MTRQKVKNSSIVLLAILMVVSLCLGLANLEPMKASAKADNNSWYFDVHEAYEGASTGSSFSMDNEDYIYYPSTVDVGSVAHSLTAPATGEYIGFSSSKKVRNQQNDAVYTATSGASEKAVGIRESSTSTFYKVFFNLNSAADIEIYYTSGTAITTDLLKYTVSYNAGTPVSQLAIDVDPNTDAYILSDDDNRVIKLSYSATASGTYEFNLFNSGCSRYSVFRASVTRASSASVTYDANGGTSEMTDATEYDIDGTVTVLANGFTAPTGKQFRNFNTKADGTGTTYAPASTFSISSNTTLYAQWDIIIEDVIAPNNITKLLPNVTTVADLGLPATLTVNCGDGTTTSVSVNWDTASFVIEAGSSTINGTISTTAPAGYVYSSTFLNETSVDVEILADAIQITSFTVPTKINVLVGSKTATLPTKIIGNTATPATYEFDVDWDTDELETKLATVNANAYVTGGIVVDVNVFTLAEGILPTTVQYINVYNYTIKAASPITDIDMRLGATSIDLPTQVEVTYDDEDMVEQTTMLSVVWDKTIADFTLEQTYSLVGTITETTLYSQPATPITADLDVNVLVYEISSVASLTGVEVVQNATDVTLPSSVQVTYDTDKNDIATIEWNKSTIIYATIGNYTVYGTLTLPTGLKNNATTAIKAEVVVNVVDYISASTARSTDFTDSSITIAEATNRGYTFTGGTTSKDASGDFSGVKIKNGKMSFTLTKATTVSFALFKSNTSVTVTFGIDGATELESLYLASDTGIKAFTKSLEAGTYSITSNGTGGSTAIKYIVINDGGTEVFAAINADSTNVTLPTAAATKKVVGSVEYKFYGFANAAGTLYATGSEVASSPTGVMYYAVYANAEFVNSFGFLVNGDVQKVRFTAKINALNGVYYLNALAGTDAVAFGGAVTIGGVAATTDAVTYTSEKSGDSLIIRQEIAVATDSLAQVYSSNFAISINTNQLSAQVLTATPDVVAQNVIDDVTSTADATHTIEVETGKFSKYTALQYSGLKAYLASIYTFTSVETIANKTINIDDAHGLPTTVSVKDANEVTKLVNVTWASAPTFDNTTAGDYTFTATFETSKYVVNSGVTLQVVVTVAAAPVEITSAVAITDINIYVGDTAPALPTIVQVNVEGSATPVEFDVVWTPDKTFDSSVAGTITYTGAITLTSGYANTALVTAEVKVVVNALTELDSAVSVPDINITLDDAEPTLPTTVEVNVVGGSTPITFNVVWTPDKTFDSSVAGTITYTGAITLTSGYANTAGITAEVKVVIA